MKKDHNGRAEDDYAATTTAQDSPTNSESISGIPITRDDGLRSSRTIWVQTILCHCPDCKRRARGQLWVSGASQEGPSTRFRGRTVLRRRSQRPAQEARGTPWHEDIRFSETHEVPGFSGGMGLPETGETTFIYCEQYGEHGTFNIHHKPHMTYG